MCMKKQILFIYLFFNSALIFSQDGTFLHDYSGKPFMLNKYSKVVEGSPFFKDNFLSGKVVIDNGVEFKNQLLRLNLLENQLHYLDDKKQEMIATAYVKEAVLFDSLYYRHHFFIHSDFLKGENKPGTGWYERLSTGKAFLLKQYKKELKETPLYGSATTELSITTQPRYYVLNGGKWNQVKKLKNISELLSDKKTELSKFIKDQKLDVEKEENLIALVNFYNSLQ